MSNFFKSAAMSLLSKTLQTLLSKYLSDVDVEGVNLPSLLYNSDDGWGVRLSNVKLRDGAKLMDLPGKRPKKDKKVRNDKTKSSSTTRKRRQGRKKTRRKKQQEDEDSETSSERPGGDTQGDKETNNNISDDSPPSHGSPTSQAGSDNAESKESDTRTTQQSTPESDTETIGSSQPQPPPPSSSSSWFFWRSSSSRVTEMPSSSHPHPSTETQNENQEPDSIPEDNQYGGSKSASSLSLASDNQQENKVSHASSRHDSDWEEPKEGEREVIDEYEEDEEKEVDDDSTIDEEEDDLPMILRLGNDGRIGTLDVRLVGRTIHVYVEDASLTVEAVRLASTATEDKGEAAPGTQDRKKSVKTKPDPQTVGDRVLNENGLARALSAIPNLFLRDIRVLFVIRDEIYDQPSQEETASSRCSIDDAIVDLSVEFLSVTDGDDFLANYREGAEGEGDETESNFQKGSEDPMYEDVMEPVYDQNEYLFKRIRTGRGPEGGILLRIYPPGKATGDMASKQRPLWSRYTWESMTQYCFLRCSGLDLFSRIYLGTKEEVASGDVWFSEDNENYDVDAMLFGVDYIAPGPQPPLPPIGRSDSILSSEDKYWVHEGAMVYQEDDNGIQSSSIKSSFHRVARNMIPSMCKRDHLPCEDCPYCWEPLPGIPLNHPLDDRTPMGGLVLSILTRDPLELNVDRPSLAVLGDIVSLFRKKAEDPVSADDAPGDKNETGMVENDPDDSLQSSNDRILSHRTSSRIEEAVDNVSNTGDSEEEGSADLTSSFPQHMQPEKIQIIGIHISELLFRVHVMREDDVYDEGLTYCFWDLNAKCITVDQQKLTPDDQLSFQDLRFDVGHLTLKEYKGPGNKQLISLGLRQRVVEFDEVTIETLKTREEVSGRSPWPSTAAALLDVQPPLETLIYEERDRHAFQFRYIVVSGPEEYSRRRSHANIRFGPASIDAPYDIRFQVPTIIREAKATILGPPPPVDDTDGPPLDSVMKYKIHLDGGKVKLEPRMEIKMPLTVIDGERSAALGLFFQTCLDRVNFSYGQQSPAPRFFDYGLSLKQLSDLPESIRLRILLLLPDLSPLERALCVKRETNSFLRCRALNKAIVKVSKRVSRRMRTSRNADAGEPTTSRRQELMTELLKMDDDTLEDLVLAYKRYNRSSR